MVRLSKQARRRAVSYKRPSKLAKKTGALKDALPNGFKEHPNALLGDTAKGAFFPKTM
jgi:hypothetical protein